MPHAMPKLYNMKSQTQMRKLVFHFISIQNIFFFGSGFVFACWLGLSFGAFGASSLGGLFGPISSLSRPDCCDLEVYVTHRIEIFEFIIFIHIFFSCLIDLKSNDR